MKYDKIEIHIPKNITKLVVICKDDYNNIIEEKIYDKKDINKHIISPFMEKLP